MTDTRIDTSSNDELQRLAREIRTQIGAPESDDANEPDLVFQALLQVVKDEREACADKAMQLARHPGPAGQMAKQIAISIKNRGLTPFGSRGQFDGYRREV